MAVMNPKVLISVVIFVVILTSLLNTMITGVLGINTTDMSAGATALVAIFDIIIVSGALLAVWKAWGH